MRSRTWRDSGILRDLAAGGLYEVVVVITSALTFVVLGRELGPTSFGYYVAIQNLVSVVGVVAGGSPAVLLQRVLRDGGDAGEAMASLLTWSLVGAACSTVLGAVLSLALLPGVGMGVVAELVVGQVLGAATVSLGVVLVQAVHGFSRASALRLLARLSRAAVLLALWSLRDVTLGSVAFWWLVVSVAAGAVSLLVAAAQTGVRIRLGRPRFGDVRLSSVYAAVGLCFAVEEDADKVLLIRFGFPAVAGVYSAAYRMVQLGLLPLRTAVNATHNRFLAHDPNAVGQHRRRSVRFTVPSAAYGLACTVALWLSAPLVPVVLGREYAGTVVMTRWLSLLVALRSVTVFPFNGLMGLGRTGWRTVVLASSATVGIVVDLFMIPRFSWRGAVVGTLAGEVVFSSLSWACLLVFQHRHDRGARLEVP